MADDIVIGVVTYRRSEDGEWVEVISKACHTTVPDLVPFLDEIERLRRWKAEAIEVLNRWDAVAVMVPARLGERKSETAAAEIERLRAAYDALAIAYRNFGGPLAAYDAALRAWDEVRHG